MRTSKLMNSSMVPKPEISMVNDVIVNKKEVLSLLSNVGSLIYTASKTLPDHIFCCEITLAYVQRLCLRDWMAPKHALIYLKGRLVWHYC